MVHDPRRDESDADWAGSLFFFIVAVLVMGLGAVLESIQRLPPLQIKSSAIVILLLLALVLLILRLRRGLR